MNQQHELTEQEVAEFYDTVYYRTEILHAIRPLTHYRKMVAFLWPIKQRGVCLDVGCGTGLFLKAAVEAGLQAYGVDISQRAVDIAKRNVPTATVIRSKGEELPFADDMFDYVFFGGTLEHFMDVDRGLEEAVRVAKDDVTFLIVVPNKNYWLWKVRGKYGTHQSELKELLLNRPSWEQLFRKHGLTVVRTHHDPWPREAVAIFKFKNPWRILRRAVYQLIWAFIPLRFTYQFVFVCKRADTR